MTTVIEKMAHTIGQKAGLPKPHRWRAIVQFDLTPEDAAKMVKGTPGYEGRGPEQIAGDDAPVPDDPRPFLGLHNLVAGESVVVCYDCEQGWSPELAAVPCEGQPPGELAYVDEGGREVPGTRTVKGQRSNVADEFRGVGRNDRCPCGSGRKFKRCHGA